MAATDGYAVIRKVIPADLAREAAASIPGTLKVRQVFDSVTEYEPKNHEDDPNSPSIGEKIRDHFVKVKYNPYPRLSLR